MLHEQRHAIPRQPDFSASTLHYSRKYDMPLDLAAAELARRRFLQLSGAGALSLGGLWQAQALAEQLGSPAAQRIKACVFVFYYGGQSHLDSYDVKPNAPS